MIVKIAECLEGARSAQGLVVVIDVYRAFSLACYAAANGAERYVAVDDVDLARDIAAQEKGVLVGERDCIRIDGFDFGNSPTEIEHEDFSGRTLVHTTSAGTQGLVAALGAGEVITGAFVNAAAVVEYVRRTEPEVVTLVAMGEAGRMRAQEDMMCAMYIKNEIENYPNSFKTLKKFLATVPGALKFFDETKDYAPERDFDLCMDLDRFDFVLKAGPRDGGGVWLRRISVA
ncbi:2-phosphosulfolactate phosphatase [Pseudodesulfovibrio tunisiensis]|uniref:2-phosphosulfolactate phosphatase n=1 Tax=Pseudodesulfovibrio tunisiensis TaxID=463192 RepID=UPI001FB50283|nr:2-phosphosulfolactate phosphatase [Pseudodesulfovibrio tunisiensis]